MQRLRRRDKVGLTLLSMAVPFLLFWFTAGANQGGSCWCPFECAVHGGGGDPPTGGGGPPQGGQNQQRGSDDEGQDERERERR